MTLRLIPLPMLTANMSNGLNIIQTNKHINKLINEQRERERERERERDVWRERERERERERDVCIYIYIYIHKS